MSGHLVRWMFHSTAMVPDYDLAVHRLGTLFGLRVLEYGESSEPGIGRRGGMAWVGDNSIEIGQPVVDGAARQFVERHGGGVHSVALQVDDLEATMAHLTALGVRIAARPLPEMCFTDPRDTGGVFLQWSCFALADDPRFGATLPAPDPGVTVPVSQHAFVGALVAQPLELARRLTELAQTDVTFLDRNAGPSAPTAGVSLGDCTLALFGFSPDDTAALWGRRYERPRTHLVGLRTADLDAASRTLLDVGVPILRSDERFLLVDPSATGGVQIALCDDLLEGDPRL